MACPKLTYEPTLKVIARTKKTERSREAKSCAGAYQYKFGAKEWQDELGLNMYDMDMRQYDPAIARWVVLDPVIHHSMSPYNAFDNNPVFWADPSGADSVFDQQGVSASSVTVMGSGITISAGGAGDGGDNSEENKNAFIDITKENYNITEKQENIGDWLYLNVDSIDDAVALLKNILGDNKLDNLVLDTHGSGEKYDNYGNVTRDALIANNKDGGITTTSDLSKNNTNAQSLSRLISFVKNDGNFILASCYTGQSNLFGQFLHALTSYQNNIYINNDFSTFHRNKDINGVVRSTDILGPITSIDNYEQGWDYFKAGDNSSTVNNVRNISIRVDGSIKVRQQK